MSLSEKVVVDRAACQRVADILRRAGVPEDREEINLPLATEDVGNFYLSLVAICHQTQQLHGQIAGAPMRGWDYLQAKWLQEAERNANLLTPEGWASITTDALIGIFSDPKSGNTMNAVAQRVQLLNDLGGRMTQEGWRSLSDLYAMAGGKILTDVPNLISLLTSFRAYNDPVRKKSFFLLGLMRNTVGWVYSDAEKLGTPVDYHEVRGHLRVGTVKITDSQLSEKLLNRIPVEEAEDVALRGQVAEAISSIAEMSGVGDQMRLHYLFWNVFRTVCLREHPHCTTPPAEAVPARYARLLALGKMGGCPFASVCRSADLELRYLEHSFETDWY